jgi:hypothetical protein
MFNEFSVSFARQAIKDLYNLSHTISCFLSYRCCILSVVVASSTHHPIPKFPFNQTQLKQSLFFRCFFPVTPKQIERLYSRFTSLDRSDCGTLSREDFLRIPELAINPLCDRIVHSFIADSNDDRVNFRQFMQVLARFRTIKKGKENKLNNREEKLRCELNVAR